MHNYVHDSLSQTLFYFSALPAQNTFPQLCVCVFTAVCVSTLDGWNAEHKFRVWVTILGRMSRHFVFCIIKRNKFHDASNTKQNKMAQHLCKIQMHLHYNLMLNVNALACNATVSWNENNCQRSAMLSLLMGFLSRLICGQWLWGEEEETGLYCLIETGRKDHQWCFLQYNGRISRWLKLLQVYYSARYRGCADLFIMDFVVSNILSASASSGFWVKPTEYNLADQFSSGILRYLELPHLILQEKQTGHMVKYPSHFRTYSFFFCWVWSSEI